MLGRRAFCKARHATFLNEEKEAARQQDLVYAQKLQEKEERAAQKILRESMNQISYFTIPTLRTIRTYADLVKALGTLTSKTQKVDFLRMLISMYVIGFGIGVSIQFSSTKDKTIGKYEDLLNRSKALLQAKHVIPERTPTRKAKLNSNPADFGLTLLAEWTESVAIYDDRVSDQVDKVLELDRIYGVRLLYDWDSIQRQYWDVPLSDLQKEFRRGRKFSDEGTMYVVVGLSWDTTKSEYAAYYYEYIQSEQPPKRVNDPEDRIIHSFFSTVPGIYNGIDGWDIDWRV